MLCLRLMQGSVIGFVLHLHCVCPIGKQQLLKKGKKKKTKTVKTYVSSAISKVKTTVRELWEQRKLDSSQLSAFKKQQKLGNDCEVDGGVELILCDKDRI